MPLKSRFRALILIAALAVSPAHAGFFGPDNEPLTPAQISERLQREPISFSGGGTALEIRTKGAAIGGFIIGAILGSAMASGGSVSGNPAQMQQQMQARTEIAQQFSANFQVAASNLSAEAAAAAAAETAKRGPLPLLLQTLGGDLRERKVQLTAASADASADATAAAKPALTLKLSQTVWKLEFETFSSDYVLKTALTLELLDKAADKLHLRTICQQEYPKKAALEDWERDDHLAIAQAAEEIARLCHGQFMAALAPRSDAAMTPATPSESPAAGGNAPAGPAEAGDGPQDIAAAGDGTPNQLRQADQAASTEQ